MSAPVPSLAGVEVVESESAADYLLKAYHELRVQPGIERLVGCWGVNEEGRKDAFDVLYKAANDPREEFFEYLEKLFSVKSAVAEAESAGEELERTKKYLQIFSQCVAGEDPEILRQYRRLSSVGEVVAKKRIGDFFKDKMNQFLKEGFSDLWKERIGKVRVIANDCEALAGGGVIHKPQARRADGGGREAGGGR